MGLGLSKSDADKYYADIDDVDKIKTSLDSYATKTSLADYATKASLPDLTPYAKTADLPSNSNLANYVKTNELANYTKTNELANYVKTNLFSGIPVPKLDIVNASQGNFNNITAIDRLQIGPNDANRETNAGKFYYDPNTKQIVDFYGGGKTIGDRRVKIWDNLEVDKTINIPNGGFIELGYGVTGKNGEAGKIGYQKYGQNNALDIVGAGTTVGDRNVKIYDNLEIGGKLQVNGNLQMNRASDAWQGPFRLKYGNDYTQCLDAGQLAGTQGDRTVKLGRTTCDANNNGNQTYYWNDTYGMLYNEGNKKCLWGQADGKWGWGDCTKGLKATTFSYSDNEIKHTLGGGCRALHYNDNNGHWSCGDIKNKVYFAPDI